LFAILSSEFIAILRLAKEAAYVFIGSGGAKIQKFFDLMARGSDFFSRG
jgi:hypothetical protein